MPAIGTYGTFAGGMARSYKTMLLLRKQAWERDKRPVKGIGFKGLGFE